VLTYYLIFGGLLAIFVVILALVIKWFTSKLHEGLKYPPKGNKEEGGNDLTRSPPPVAGGRRYSDTGRYSHSEMEKPSSPNGYESMRDGGPLYDDWLSYSPVESESVAFAIFAPRSITPNSSFVLDVWAYLANQYSSITAMAQELGRDANLGRKTGVPVPKGAILTIAVNIKGLEIEDPIDTVVWNSEPANASFIIKVPVDCAIGKYPGRAIIKHQGIAIAKIVFLISVDTIETLDYIDHSAETLYPKSAFASYASANRGEVLSRIQGMKKVAPELDVFLDVFSLRSGQNWQQKLEQHVPTKDTFYLFWSEPAARSEWVEREWKLALSKRGLDYIDPVPLEEPDLVPPPQELSALHFSDAYMAYIKYQSIKKQMSTQI
jgi:hypothetical protein